MYLIEIKWDDDDWIRLARIERVSSYYEEHNENLVSVKRGEFRD
jgi:hypothetical protein